MLATPDYSHFKSKDYENFYEPGEDTFLFLDAIEKDIQFLNAIDPLVVLEIGCGAGLVINFLANHLANSKRVLFLATDLNTNAIEATAQTAKKNHNNVNLINCDLVLPVIDRLEKSIDVLLFNPPYVVTEANELGSNGIEAAWAGGKDGREVMDRLFPLVDRLLSENGAFYLVCIKPNCVDDIAEVLKNFGFTMSIVLNRKAGIENLFVLKFVRKKI